MMPRIVLRAKPSRRLMLVTFGALDLAARRKYGKPGCLPVPVISRVIIYSRT
jgi:hypothetical protein